MIRKLLLGAGVAVVVLSAAGCTAAAPRTDTTQDALLAYAQCMRDNGVDLPDPVAGEPSSLYAGIDRDAPAFVAADGTCAQLLGAVVQERGQQDGQDQQERDAQLLEVAECLREHGVDVHDPVPGEGLGDGLDRTDPRVVAALEQCQQAGATP